MLVLWTAICSTTAVRRRAIGSRRSPSCSIRGRSATSTTWGSAKAGGWEVGAGGWEVGAGGESVLRSLAQRVGTSGRVLATDIDVSWSGPAAGGVLEVRRHDVILDPPPSETFDLVHARLVLVHIKDRAAALQVMSNALRPGGWLVLEDADPSCRGWCTAGNRGPQR